MLVGTLLVGLSGYLFLALIGHGRFDAATTAALSAVYLLGNILGPGVFIALEQETSRVVSDAIARGFATGSRARRLLLVDTGLGLATILTLAALTPLLLGRVFNGTVGLIAALAVAIIGSAAVYLIRGLSGGQQRFGRYAATVMIDGGTRIAGCVLLVALGSSDPVAWGFALCVGPLVAALLTGHRSGPPTGGAANVAPIVSRLARDVGLLLVASALSMIIANLAPVVVTAMLPDDPVTAAGFAGAVVLTRVPLLFMAPIQALLLPGMTAAAADGDRTGLRATVARGLVVIGAISLLAVVGTWLFGRPLVALLLGSDRDTTDSSPLVLLTAACGIFMAVQLLQPALVAIRRHRALVGAWVAGAACFAACFAIPLAPVDRGLLAQFVGPLVTLAVQLTVLQRYLRSPVRIAGPTMPVPGPLSGS